jgi:hypothetical protein
MLLRDEFLTRNRIFTTNVKFVKKGFAFFGENNDLLVIKWTSQGLSPGFYEISECILDKYIRTIKVNNIEWEDYENFLKNWALSNSIVTDKKIIFNLTWEYFIRKNESFLLQNYNHDEIFKTIDENNNNRMFDSMMFLDKISKHKSLFDFWNEKLTEVISCYCYWIASIK